MCMNVRFARDRVKFIAELCRPGVLHVCQGHPDRVR